MLLGVETVYTDSYWISYRISVKISKLTRFNFLGKIFIKKIQMDLMKIILITFDFELFKLETFYTKRSKVKM